MHRVYKMAIDLSLSLSGRCTIITTAFESRILPQRPKVYPLWLSHQALKCRNVHGTLCWAYILRHCRQRSGLLVCRMIWLLQRLIQARSPTKSSSPMHCPLISTVNLFYTRAFYCEFRQQSIAWALRWSDLRHCPHRSLTRLQSIMRRSVTQFFILSCLRGTPSEIEKRLLVDRLHFRAFNTWANIRKSYI